MSQPYIYEMMIIQYGYFDKVVSIEMKSVKLKA